MDKHKLVELYRKGLTLNLIAVSLECELEDVEEELSTLKDDYTVNKKFNDDFRRIIADRDSKGISRRRISSELNINPATVKRACEKFGTPVKEIVSIKDAFQRIDGDYGLDECITCESKKVNVVDHNTIYCLNCGDEHIIYDGYAVKVIWEHID